VVAGLGNIYVDEALLLAGIHPLTSANSISPARLRRLVPTIRERLELAIAVGGSTLRDYRSVAGEAGGMQERFAAYGRAGLPCPRCGTLLRSGRVAGRGTTWCPRCQRPPRT
jgi:formamidopyrimidine-DNA glycosylase